jgi:type VI secretion system protein ImpJ
VALFRTLTPEERSALADGLDYVPFAPGEAMTVQGRQVHYLYVLTRGSAEVRVSEDHIPPCLALAASETLTKLIVEIRDQITARGRQLEEYKKKRGIHSAEFGSRDMVSILALRSINRYVPLLHHYTEAREIHPWAVYGALRQLIGELSSFSERINALGEWSDGRRVVPLYDHRDLWGCFATLQDLISHLMDEITAGPEYIIRLAHDGTSYAADLRPAVFEGRNRFYLALRTEANPQDVLQAVKTVVKLGSREDMRVIVARALPGIVLEQQLQTPKELPYRSNTLYFAVSHHSEMWESVMKNRNVALYWGSAPEDLEVELMVVGRS